MFVFSLLYGCSRTKHDDWTLRFMMLSSYVFIQHSQISDCSRRLTAVLRDGLLQVACGGTNADCWEATKCYPGRHFIPKMDGFYRWMDGWKIRQNCRLIHKSRWF